MRGHLVKERWQENLQRWRYGDRFQAPCQTKQGCVDLKESTHADKGKFPTQRVFLENKQTSMIEYTSILLPYLDRLIYSSNHSFSIYSSNYVISFSGRVSLRQVFNPHLRLVLNNFQLTTTSTTITTTTTTTTSNSKFLLLQVLLLQTCLVLNN